MVEMYVILTELMLLGFGLTTCKQCANTMVTGSDVLTTRTDYGNKYPSTLRVTSYNFTVSETVTEILCELLKPLPAFNPRIHVSMQRTSRC